MGKMQPGDYVFQSVWVTVRHAPCHLYHLARASLMFVYAHLLDISECTLTLPWGSHFEKSETRTHSLTSHKTCREGSQRRVHQKN